MSAHPSRTQDQIEYEKRVSRKLRKLMSECGLTPKELSMASGVSYSMVLNCVNGKSAPGAYNIFKLCGTLGCSADELLGIGGRS